MVVYYPIVYRVLYIPGGAGFLRARFAAGCGRTEIHTENSPSQFPKDPQNWADFERIWQAEQAKQEVAKAEEKKKVVVSKVGFGREEKSSSQDQKPGGEKNAVTYRRPGEYLLRFGVWMACFRGPNSEPYRWGRIPSNHRQQFRHKAMKYICFAMNQSVFRGSRHWWSMVKL